MAASEITAGWPELVRHPAERDHVVHLYEDERLLVEAVAEFIGSGLSLGEGGLVFARPWHRNALVKELRARGLYPHRALRLIDARQVLDSVMHGNAPRWRDFESVCGSALHELRLQYPGVRAYGEMVDILWQDGRHEAALELEEYWNHLGRLRPFALLCAYAIDPLDAAAYGRAFRRMCEAHTHLVPARDYAGFNEAVDEAARRVLSQPLAQMLLSLSSSHRPRTDMPLGQAVLFWLKENMPRTADKVLQQMRETRSAARKAGFSAQQG